MRCPKCKSQLLHNHNGVVRARTRGPILLKADGAHCQCYWCKADVVLPLSLQEGTEVPEERFYLGTPPPEKA